MDHAKPLARRQQTIIRPSHVSGFGYWSGSDVTIDFRPGPIDSGIVFVREDLKNYHRIQVDVGNRVNVPRRTNLTYYGYSVEMVEHVVAALAGLQVDNCEVWTTSSELPGCDGSSQPFVTAILDAGIVQQDGYCEPLVIDSSTRVGDTESWVTAEPLLPNDPAGSLILTYVLDYGGDSPIGRQTFELTLEPASFVKEVAAARTFILKAEAEWLQSQGLGSRVTCHDLLVFDETGPVDNPLRFEDECVRHKTLDLVGDLALSGRQLCGRISAFRSGHRLNAELVSALQHQQPTVSRPLLRVA